MNKVILATILFICLGTPISTFATSTSPEKNLKEAGFALPEPVRPIANYVTWRRSDNILYLSGHGACEGKSIVGKLGETLGVDQGYEAAQRVGLCVLATIKLAIGDLSKVKQVLQINGMVNAAPTFKDHSKVINGFSDIFVTAFGDDGKAARTAVGMSSLPANWAVEINAVVELK